MNADAPLPADRRPAARGGAASDPHARYEGLEAEVLADLLDLPRVVMFAEVGSTLDTAHDLAARGAPAGTLVLADAQSAGRGRQGRRWQSEAGAGVWLTLIERPDATGSLGVGSVRVALNLAAALDAHAASPVQVKWPNDLHVAGGKLAGVLLESRWRGERLDWIAAGVGINVRAPAASDLMAAALQRSTTRLAVLRAVVPAIRQAIAARGPLSPMELAAWAARDLAMGRRATAPVAGIVAGIAPDGGLLIDTNGARSIHHAGSLLLEPLSNESPHTP